MLRRPLEFTMLKRGGCHARAMEVATGKPSSTSRRDYQCDPRSASGSHRCVAGDEHFVRGAVERSTHDNSGCHPHSSAEGVSFLGSRSDHTHTHAGTSFDRIAEARAVGPRLGDSPVGLRGRSLRGQRSASAASRRPLGGTLLTTFFDESPVLAGVASGRPLPNRGSVGRRC